MRILPRVLLKDPWRIRRLYLKISLTFTDTHMHTGRSHTYIHGQSAHMLFSDLNGLPARCPSLARTEKKSAHIHSRTHWVRDQPCFKQFLQNQKNTTLQSPVLHFSSSGLHHSPSFFFSYALSVSVSCFAIFMLSDGPACWHRFFSSDSGFINEPTGASAHTNLARGIVGSPEVAVPLLCHCPSPVL